MKTTHSARDAVLPDTQRKALSDERPEAFRLYRAFEFARAPRPFTLERALVLDVATWRAGFG